MANTILVLLMVVFVQSQASPPRVIVFQLGDDYGHNNVGYPHGPNGFANPEMKTPTMTKLAVEQGIRLERHYVYKFCSPTRSSFLSGRLPVHVNQNNNCNDASSPSGIDLRMTLLPQKLKLAGYSTAMVGKWHCGARSRANLPVNRGFDYHIGFLKGGEDHFQQNRCAGGPDASTIDLWQLNSPAYGRNGVYSAHLYAKAAVDVITNFTRKVQTTDPSLKLFLYLPWHNTHTPLEAPENYFYPPVYNDSFEPRMAYNAMARALDEGMGNVTEAIRAGGFWNSTLIVFSADNGGWMLPGGVAGSSNYPLRGGKVTDFEGGVRAVAFLSGGYLPANVRGSSFSGIMAVADWYATFCHLAGVDPTDIPSNTSVPATDSINMWPALMVPNSSVSPRQSILLSGCLQSQETTCPHSNDSALIVGDYKILCGTQGGVGFHQWPGFPNGTQPEADAGCPQCCMFNVVNDPSEYHDLRSTDPVRFKNMSIMLEQAIGTIYQTNYADPDAPICITNSQAKELYKGFIGPMCFQTSPFPPTPPPRPFALEKNGYCLIPGENDAVISTPCNLLNVAPSVSGMTSDNLRVSDSFRVWIQDESNSGYLALVGNDTSSVKYIKLDEHPDGNVTKKSDFCIRGRVYLNPDKGEGNTHQGFLYNAASTTLESSFCEIYRCLHIPTNGTRASSGRCNSDDGGWHQQF